MKKTAILLLLVLAVSFSISAGNPFHRLRAKLLGAYGGNDGVNEQDGDNNDGSFSNRHGGHRGGHHGGGGGRRGRRVAKICDFVVAQFPETDQSECMLFGQQARMECFQSNEGDSFSANWNCFREKMVVEYTEVDWAEFEQEVRLNKVTHLCEFVEAQLDDPSNPSWDPQPCIDESIGRLNKCIEQQGDDIDFMACKHEVREEIFTTYGVVGMNEMDEKVSETWSLNSCRDHPGDDSEKLACSQDLLQMLSECKSAIEDEEDLVEASEEELNGFVRRCVRRSIRRTHHEGAEGAEEGAEGADDDLQDGDDDDGDDDDDDDAHRNRRGWRGYRQRNGGGRGWRHARHGNGNGARGGSS